LRSCGFRGRAWPGGGFTLVTPPTSPRKRAGDMASETEQLKAAIAADDAAGVAAAVAAGASVNGDASWRPLCAAAEGGKAAAFAALRTAGADATQLQGGKSVLRFAVFGGNADVIRAAAAMRADVADAGVTPVHVAACAAEDDATLVEAALLCAEGGEGERRAAVNAVTSEADRGLAPLHLAAAVGNVAVVAALVDAGAGVEGDVVGCSPLHIAAMCGNIEAVKELASNGGDVNARDSQDWTPLHLASFKGHAGVVSALLDSFAVLDACDRRGASPLHLAVKQGQTAIVFLLLAQGAAVNAATADGSTSLHLASWNGDLLSLGALLDAGANVNAKGTLDTTALHQASLNGHMSAVIALLQAGASVDARDCEGATPLHLAWLNGNVAVVRGLLQAGADANDGDITGLSFLDQSLCLHRWEEATAFVEFGADLHPGGRSPESMLHTASLHNQARLLKALLLRGVSPAALDSQGRSPCMYAAMGGHTEAFHVLLPCTVAAGHITAADAKGRSLLHYAAAAASKPIVLALLAAGADPLQADGDGKLPLLLVPNTAAAPIDGDAAKEAIVDALQTAMARLAQARGNAGLLAALTQSRIALPVTADEAITAAQIAGCTLQTYNVLAVTRFLGRGTNGEVWAATIRNPDRGALEREVDAVVKRTHWPAAPADAAARGERAFWREVVMQHACRTHRGVARCYGGFIEPPSADGWVRGTMVMERCAGSLDQALTSLAGAPQPLAVRLRWVRQVLAAFAYLHGRDIVHGDIKSANVLVTADGEVKVTDFGYCALRREETAAAGDAAHVGERGSPAYMCPAVALGLEPLRKASDAYSCGVLLWELLSGSRPHGALDVATLPLPPADLAERASAWVRARGGTPDAAAMARFYCAALRGLRPATPEQLAALQPAGIGGWIAAMWHPEPRLRPTLEDALPAIAALLGDSGGDAGWAWPGAAAGGADGRHELPALAVGPGGVFGTAGGVADAATAPAAAPAAVPTALESVWMGSCLLSTRPATGGVPAAAPSLPPVAEGCGVEESKEG
jgi:ankyrin repeat protein